MEHRALGRYEILEEIGRGGMATVYRATDRQFEREVAVKVLPRQFTHDPTFLSRFKLEGQTIAALEHAAIVPVYDFGEARDFPYLVMRYMRGGTLGDRLRQGPLSLEEIAPILGRVAGALDAAHHKGIIHRDLKPTNILFDSEGYAFLSDFGILKLVEATASFTDSTIVGTPAYMSPEQVTGDAKIDSRSDVYSLGIILFEMLAGLKPYIADTPTKEMMAHVLQPVPNIQEVNRDIPDTVAAIVEKAIAKEPDNRYQTAGALAEEINRQATGTALPAAAGKVTAARTTGASSSRILKISLLALAILSAVVVIGLVSLNLIGQGAGGSESLDDALMSTAVEQSRVASLMLTSEATPSEAATPIPSETHTARPSNTPSQTPVPPTPSRTRTASPTATSEPISQAQVTLSSVNVRSGPGINYPPVDILLQDDVVVILARNPQGTWFLVELLSGGLGWVSSTVVELIEPDQPEQIPTAATIPAPPPTDTPTPTPTPTPVPPAPKPRPQRTNTPAS